MGVSTALADRHFDRIHAIIDGTGKCVSPPSDDRVTRSWMRCATEYGLTPLGAYQVDVRPRKELLQRQEKLQQVLTTAQVEMANLYQQLAGSGFAVLLADADGVVMDCIGDSAFTDKAFETGIFAGAVWSESQQGTNGMGTCLIEKRPMVVHQLDHFLFRNTGLTCSASPIFGPAGEIIAVLDASSDSRLAQQHTLALVNMSAQTIENRIFINCYKNEFVVRFHSRPEFVGTLGEGQVAISQDGQVIAANRSALFQLGFQDRHELVGLGINQVFTLSLGALIDQSARNWTTPAPIFEARHGNRFFAVTQQPENLSVSVGTGSIRRSRPVPCPQRNAGAIRLDDLALSDSRITENIHRAKRALGSDIPVLLLGETGTGKELFAKAIHNSAPGGDGKPFVAVNCASLPESLIESELFGYKPGAFTGASREGRRGRILQANGGTLFLDEIGDMPLQLQARLLRVLEEREVCPLGSESSVTVEFRLICATHRDLLDVIAQGQFREDLYYRVQGITLLLPALRDRTDKRELIRSILASEARPSAVPEIDEDALLALENYSWPGNIRQLRNALRAALALNDGALIRSRDLPSEIATFRGRSAVATTQGPDAAEGRVALNPLQSAERDVLIQGLERHRWKVTGLARELDISRNTLYRKMRRLGIKDLAR
jgi:transcriptional regulator of acetoin/glycerol metabolism